jgi:hypothetical protein
MKVSRDALMDLGDFADYNEAIRLNPQEAGAFNSRGNTYCHLGRPDLAIAH